MRNFFLLSLLFLTMQTNAMIMNGEGITTSHGSLKWQNLMSLPQQVNTLEKQIQTLQKVCVVGSILIAGMFVYLKWFNQTQSQEPVIQDNDLVMLDLE